MNEDISATLRLAMTLIMLAAIMTTVVSLASVGFNYYYNYIDSTAMAVNNVQASAIMDISKLRKVSAAEVYKYVSINEGSVKSLEIRYKNGTTTADYRTLLKNAEKDMKVEVTIVGNGLYKIKVREV